MGCDEGLELYILLLTDQLLHHLDVTVLVVLHQHQVGRQTLLHGSFRILADPLEVSTDLERTHKTQVQLMLVQGIPRIIVGFRKLLWVTLPHL